MWLHVAAAMASLLLGAIVEFHPNLIRKDSISSSLQITLEIIQRTHLRQSSQRQEKSGRNDFRNPQEQLQPSS